VHLLAPLPETPVLPLSAPPGGAQARRTFVRALLGLSADPPRALRWIVAVLLGCGGCLVGLHIAARTFLAGVAGATADGHIGALDLGDEANLAVWFASFQLLLIALVCLLNAWTETSRRSVPWRLGSWLFLMMAIDETGGLHEVFGKLMVRLLPALPLEARTWWILPYSAALALVMLGGLQQMRGRAAFAALIACACWGVAVFADHVVPTADGLGPAFEEGLEMLGGSLFVLAFGSHLVRRIDCIPREGASPCPPEDPRAACPVS
jgi:hypothetical protein